LASVWIAGLRRFFRHQAEAINAALAGQHIAIATATSSGKSVVYNVPVLRSVLEAPDAATALYLFPTKALAQDQLRSLRELLAASPALSARVRADTYDGDTAFADRNEVRLGSAIILSNPDMLHQTLLPQHKFWSRFLKHLKVG
jgi:DEAD/DEAH box helicase domain-containing protein